MKKNPALWGAAAFALILGSILFSCDQLQGPGQFGWIDRPGNGGPGSSFVPVTNITGVPTQLGPNLNGLTLPLGGTVEPANATNQTIVWSVKSAGTSGAAIIGSTFTADDDGKVTVTATIADGLAAGTPYTQDFTIDVEEDDVVPGVGIIKRVTIPAGTFMMGSPVTEPDRFAGEEDQRQVSLSAFKMAKHEVTQAQWVAVMGTNPSWYNGVQPIPSGSLDYGIDLSRPVDSVSWYDAIAFCNKLSILAGLEEVYSVYGISDWAGLAYSSIPTGDNPDWNAVVMHRNKSGYRLPTEAEWEYACRAGTTTAYYTGDDTLINELNAAAYYYGTSGNVPHPVGGKAPNAWGLFDMHGNLFEWCWDWVDFYGPGPDSDPEGPASDNPGFYSSYPGLSGPRRVDRGGDYHNDYKWMRSAYRGHTEPWFRRANIDDGMGFRVVRRYR